ncbi:MAG: hypothetical protein JOY64_06655 [Alphaproteobacteria bacterium]|nr:hypothetical protein [Alphaproteobacteria bacterium]MBV8407291.1 hypothetical protein [Alphaproteobacteria bacterium]
MAKVVWTGVVLALGVAACSSPPRPAPPVWSTNYAVPFDTMVNCLTSMPTNAFTIGAPTPGFGGVVTIAYVPTNVPQANSYFRVYRVPENGVQVSWFRANDVMGLDWIDGEARSRANSCGGIPYQGDRSYQGVGP